MIADSLNTIRFNFSGTDFQLVNMPWYVRTHLQHVDTEKLNGVGPEHVSPSRDCDDTFHTKLHDSGQPTERDIAVCSSRDGDCN